jgi:hypothetical protein
LREILHFVFGLSDRLRLVVQLSLSAETINSRTVAKEGELAGMFIGSDTA